MAHQLSEKYSVEISDELAEAALLSCGGGRHDYFTLLGISPRQATPDDAQYALQATERELRKILYDKDLGDAARALKKRLGEIAQQLGTPKGIADYRREIEAAPRRQQMALLRQLESEASDVFGDPARATPERMRALRRRAGEIGLKPELADTLLRRLEEAQPLPREEEQVIDREHQIRLDDFPQIGAGEAPPKAGRAADPTAEERRRSVARPGDTPWDPHVSTDTNLFEKIFDSGEEDRPLPTLEPSTPPPHHDAPVGGLRDEDAPIPILQEEFHQSGAWKKDPDESEPVPQPRPKSPRPAQVETPPPPEEPRAPSPPPRPSQPSAEALDEARAALRKAAEVLPKAAPNDRKSARFGRTTWHGFFPIHGRDAAASRALIEKAGSGQEIGDDELNRRARKKATAIAAPAAGPSAAPSPEEEANALKRTALMESRPASQPSAPPPAPPSPKKDRSAAASAPTVLDVGQLPTIGTMPKSAKRPKETPAPRPEASKPGGFSNFMQEYALLAIVLLFFCGMVGGIVYMMVGIPTLGSASSGGGTKSATGATPTRTPMRIQASGTLTTSSGTGATSAGTDSSVASASPAARPTSPSFTPRGSSPIGGDSGAVPLMVYFDEGFLGPYYLRAFEMRAHEVTNGEYSRFVANAGYEPPLHWESGRPVPGTEELPVVNVSLQDANRYLQWLTSREGDPNTEYRLPTLEHYHALMAPNMAQLAQAHVNAEKPVPVTATGMDAVQAGSGVILHLFGNVAEWAQAPQTGDPLVVGFGYRAPSVDPNALVRTPAAGLEPDVGFRYVRVSVK